MKQRFAPLFFYYIILAVLGIIILRWLGHWRHPASGFRGGVGVAKRPCSPSHARQAPRHRPRCAQRVGQMHGARWCSWSRCWRRVLALIVGRMSAERIALLRKKSASLLPIWCTIFKPHRLKDFDSLWQQKNLD